MQDLEAGLPVCLVDADPQLAIGSACRGLVTTTATREDLRKKHTDPGMDFGCGITAAQQRDFDIAFIDASPASGLLQRQNTCAQAKDVSLQGRGECCRIPGAHAVAKAGH